MDPWGVQAEVDLQVTGAAVAVAAMVERTSGGPQRLQLEAEPGTVTGHCSALSSGMRAVPASR